MNEVFSGYSHLCFVHCFTVEILLVLSCRRYNPPLVGAPLQVGTLIKLG